MSTTETVLVKDAMRPAPHTIGIEQTLEVARHMLLRHDVRHLPVEHGGQLKGILTERDIEFALRVERADPAQMRVGEAMTEDVYFASPETPLAEVASRMAQDHLGSALVVDNGKLVGIFTTVDACRILAETLAGRLQQ